MHGIAILTPKEARPFALLLLLLGAVSLVGSCGCAVHRQGSEPPHRVPVELYLPPVKYGEDLK